MAIAGAEGATDHGSVVIGQITPGPVAESTFYIPLSTSVVQNWVSNPSQNRGMIFINDDALSGYRIVSHEAADAATHPTYGSLTDQTRGPFYQLNGFPAASRWES